MATPKRSHPFPSRTRKLSFSGPMVLQARACGRVGRCRGFEGPFARTGSLLFRGLHRASWCIAPRARSIPSGPFAFSVATSSVVLPHRLLESVRAVHVVVATSSLVLPYGPARLRAGVSRFGCDKLPCPPHAPARSRAGDSRFGRDKLPCPPAWIRSSPCGRFTFWSRQAP